MGAYFLSNSFHSTGRKYTCYTAENGHLKIVEILFSEGAKLDSRDNVSTYNNVMSLGYRTYM